MRKREAPLFGPVDFRTRLRTSPLKQLSLSSQRSSIDDFLKTESPDNPEAALLAQEEADVLREVYLSLSKEEQEIAHHALLLDLANENVVKKLKITLPAVKSRKFRTRIKMREKWTKKGLEPRGFLLYNAG